MTYPLAAETYIPKRWLPFLRALWILMAVSLFVLYAWGLGANYGELVKLCQDPTCPVMTIAPEELRILENHGLSLRTFAFFYLALEGSLIVLFSGLAGLVFWRRSDTWVGWIVSLAFLFAALVFFSEEPRALARAYPHLKLLIDFLTSVSVVLVLMLFYIFPDGRFIPRWMRWFAAVLIAAVVLDPILNQGGTRAASATMFVILAFAVGAPMGLISQIYRFRKVSNSTQRQQTKWVVFGFLCLFGGMLPWMIFAEIAPLAPGLPRLIFYLSLIPQYMLIGMFPISVAIAIFRYRLWEIDLVIRRTLQYSLLTGLLILVYFGSVVLLQSLVESLTGGQSPVVIVISTLGIAALFNPLRLHIQDFIDRRFYRKKYDAEKALARFAIAARDEVDMHHLTANLITVIDETLEPEEVSLWLKQSRTNSEPI